MIESVTGPDASVSHVASSHGVEANLHGNEVTSANLFPFASLSAGGGSTCAIVVELTQAPAPDLDDITTDTGLREPLRSGGDASGFDIMAVPSASPLEERLIPRRQQNSPKPAVQHSNLAMQLSTLECLESEMLITPDQTPRRELFVHLEHKQSFDDFKLPISMGEDCAEFSCTSVKEEEEGDFDRTVLFAEGAKSACFQSFVHETDVASLASADPNHAVIQGSPKLVVDPSDRRLPVLEGSGSRESTIRDASPSRSRSMSPSRRRAVARDAIQSAIDMPQIDNLKQAVVQGEATGLDDRSLSEARKLMTGERQASYVEQRQAGVEGALECVEGAAAEHVEVPYAEVQDGGPALARRVQEGRTRLSHALSQGELKGVLSAMRECEAAGMPDAELRAVKRELSGAAKNAANAEDVSELEERKTAARRALRDALRTGAVDMLRSALQTGSLAGLDPVELLDANERLAAATLRQAAGLNAIGQDAVRDCWPTEKPKELLVRDSSVEAVAHELADDAKAVAMDDNVGPGGLETSLRDPSMSENFSDGSRKLALRSQGVTKKRPEQFEKKERSQAVAAKALQGVLASHIPHTNDGISADIRWKSNSERSEGWLSRATGARATEVSVPALPPADLKTNSVDSNHLPPIRRTLSAPGEVRNKLSVGSPLCVRSNLASSVSVEIDVLKAQLEEERSQRRRLCQTVSDLQRQLRLCKPPVSPTRAVYLSSSGARRQSRRKMAPCPGHVRSSPCLHSSVRGDASNSVSDLRAAQRVVDAPRNIVIPGVGSGLRPLVPPMIDFASPPLPLEPSAPALNHARTVMLEKRLLSERRVHQVMELEKTGQDTWRLRRQVKAQRLKDQEVFPNKMWGTFFKWQAED